ncbi:hypothetical protein [Chitinophaga tropicalis]|uniref:Lipocalin-like domain-containing protein n=1 Tax=Chitinophaga tropicalis TaxID=2683588 RepID=A0A7K1U7A6_9BACT|nr:hypothetical protein [Chitinophaga tropicalis]MVT10243.1 hypothetical protein [Chitinophaga tropicalis]
MKFANSTFFVSILFLCCNAPKAPEQPVAEKPLTGTWRLVSAKVITKGDTVSTFPVAGQEMIKMFNATHFSFFKHDVGEANAVFDAGAGTFTLSGEDYKEQLSYCSAREWENRGFSFKVSFHHDTLVQKGVEKIDSLNINQEIVEVYVKVN